MMICDQEEQGFLDELVDSRFSNHYVSNRFDQDSFPLMILMEYWQPWWNVLGWVRVEGGQRVWLNDPEEAGSWELSIFECGFEM